MVSKRIYMPLLHATAKKLQNKNIFNKQNSDK